MQTADDLAARLAHLERSHHRWRRLTAVALLALAAFALVGATTPAARTLELSTLKIVDGDGKLRVLLTPTSGLSFLDAEGRPRAILGIDAQGPGLMLYGEKGEGRATLSVNHDGPGLIFTGAGGALRTVLALLRDAPGLVFYDAQEQERVTLAVQGGGGALELKDATGNRVDR